MSRFEIPIPETSLQLVYGVDHVTSAFIQIVDLAAEDEDDRVIFRADNQGIEARTFPGLTVQQSMLISDFKDRYKIARNNGIRYPNLAPSDIIDIALTYGMPDTQKFRLNVYSDLD